MSRLPSFLSCRPFGLAGAVLLLALAGSSDCFASEKQALLPLRLFEGSTLQWKQDQQKESLRGSFLDGRVGRSSWVKPLRLAQAMTDQPPLRTPKPAPSASKDTITGLTSVLNLTASFNLLGLRLIATIGYKWRLYASNSRAFKDNYVSINAISRLTPAWLEVGALAAVQPASFVRLRAAYRYRLQVPAFFSGGVFESADAATKAFANVTSFAQGEQVLRDTIDARSKDNNDSRILPSSQIVSVDLTLRFKAKGFLVLANVRYSHWWSSYPQQDNFKAFYEGGHDMIFAADEDFLMVEGGIGYEWNMLRFLALTSFRKAFSANSEYFRVGPAVQWLIAPRWGNFKNPSLLVLVNWYLLHPWRGRDGVPLFAARFGGEF